MPTSDRKYVLYADGACLGNPGPGGWGVVVAEPAAHDDATQARQGLDLALVEACPGTTAAAMFTKNRVVAAPLVVGRASLVASRGRVRWWTQPRKSKP